MIQIHSRSLALCAAVLACCLFLTNASDAAPTSRPAQRGPADEVSRHAPPEFARRVAPLLTSFDAAMRQKDAMADSDATIVNLLYETIHCVKPDGRSLTAVHSIDLARTEQGAQWVARHVHSFRKFDSRIHLLIARSIQPDGSTQSAAADAAFIQSPQAEADASLFTDIGELVVVLPNVKPGTVCETLIVLDEQVSRMPGEFSNMLPLASYRPSVCLRHVIEIDPPLTQRLTVSPLGAVPEPQREQLKNGRLRLTWQRQRVPKIQWEPEPAPLEQVGPMLFVTTARDWDTVGRWYRELLKSREQVGAALDRELARQLPATAPSDRQSVIAALYRMAARDVRYVGLEFGIAGFQPQAPDAVWANRYGDCKDKANFLRVLLKQRHIDSCVALVNTRHAGRIEKRSPSSRQFDHAILALPQPDGTWLFCDPTIEYGRPGMLRPDDTGRDVLVVKDDGSTQFVRTPDLNDAQASYNLDLKLEPGGALSGWMTLTATGFDATQWVAQFSGKDRQQTRQHVLSVVQQFYSTAQLIDTELMPVNQFKDRYTLRAFFMVPATGPSDRQRVSLQLPCPRYAVPNFGDNKDRQGPYWAETNTTTVEARVKLPPRWAPLDLPRPFSVDAGSVSFLAHWEVNGSDLRSRVDVRWRQGLVMPEKFAGVYHAVSAMRSWMSEPLIVIGGQPTAHETPAATEPTSTAALADFPMMPSGEGQLELIDQRFPLDVNPRQRRQALQQVLQWFPNDELSCFVARLRLTEIDLRANPKDPAALQRARDLVAGGEGHLKAEHVALGRYLLAEWEADAGNMARAVDLLTPMIEDATISAHRRAWSAWLAATILQKDNPRRAVAILEGTLDLESEAIGPQFSLLARILLRQDDAARLQHDLIKLAAQSPGRAAKVVEALLEQSRRYSASGDRTPAVALLAVLNQVVGGSADLASLRPEVAAAQHKLEGFALTQQIAADLKAFLRDHRPDWWDATPIDPSLTDRLQFRDAMISVGKGANAQLWARYGLEYLTRFDPDEEFSHRLWQVAFTLKDRTGDDALAEMLLKCLQRLPTSDPYWAEGMFIRADRMERHQDVAGALALLRPMIEQEAVPAYEQVAAARRCGMLFEKQNEYEQALEMYRRLERDIETNRNTPDGLLRAALINLELGRPDEALRIGAILGTASPKLLEQAQCIAQVKDLIQFAKTPDAARAFWERQKTWWPKWKQFEPALDPMASPPQSQPAADVLVATVPDVTVLGQQLATAIRGNDRARAAQILRVVAHCARWQPRWCVDLATATAWMTRLTPGHLGEYHRAVISMLRGLEVPDVPLSRMLKLQLLIHYLDAGMPSDARTLLYAMVVADTGTAREHDPISQVVHRLWAIMARPGDRQQCATALEKDLPAMEGSSDRALTVLFLARVYDGLGRKEDEIALLRREKDHPAVAVDAERLAEIRQRLQALESPEVKPAPGSPLVFGSDSPARPSSPEEMAESTSAQNMGRWIAAHLPPWYSYAKPARVSDVKAQDIEKLLIHPSATTPRAETAKLGLLVAQAAEQPIDLRRVGFLTALRALKDMQIRGEEGLKLLRSVCDDDQFTHFVRMRAAVIAIADPRTPAAERKSLLELTSNWMRPDDLAAARAAIAAFAVDDDSAISLEPYLTAALEQPLNTHELFYFRRYFQRLAWIDPAAARRVYAATERLALKPEGSNDTASTPAAIRLQLAREVRHCENCVEADRIALDAIRSHFAGRTVADLPANWRDYRDVPHVPGWLDEPARVALDLRCAAVHRFPSGAAMRLQRLFHAMAAEPSGRDTLARVLPPWLEKLPADDDRQHAVPMIGRIIDIDDPAQRQWVQAIVQPWSDPARGPLAAGAVRLSDLRIALRTGIPIELDTAFKGLSGDEAASLQIETRLVLALQQKDAEAIKKLVNSMSAEALLASERLPLTLAALELAKLDDELELAREAAGRELYRAVLNSWSTRDEFQVHVALRLAIALGQPERLPPAWVQACLHLFGSPTLRLEVQATDAHLRHDWPKLKAAADELIVARPTFYEFYWLEGLALFEMGQRSEAVKPLQVYIKYDHDRLEHGRAVEMLRQAMSGPPATQPSP